MKEFIEKMKKGKSEAEKLMIMASVSPVAAASARKIREKEKYMKMAMSCAVILFCGLTVINPSFASSTKEDLWGTIKPFLNLITMIFQVIGFVMIVFSSGQLIVAFKSDDPDSKVRASYTLLAGVGLLILPTVLKTLGVLNKDRLDNAVQ
jgi:hypothetical protein